MTERSRKVIFFLGAGASAYADIPTVVPMTERFLRFVQSNHPKLSKVLEKVAFRLKLASNGEVADIESIMRTLHRLIDHETDELAQFLEETHGLKLTDLSELKDILQSYIRNSVLKPKDVSYLAPILDTIWGGPAEIFSVNYDPCIELLSRNLQRRLVDGFTPEWNPQSLSTDDSSAVCLYKLHGSVLWYQTDSGWPIKIPIGPAGPKIELYDGSTAEPIMLYPMHKQPIEAPLLDFTYLLKQKLESAAYLVVIGYSFRDDYLSALIRDAFNSNSDLRMINISPEAWNCHQTLISKSPTYERVFRNRVTDLPFPAEKVLSKLTEDFNGFAGAINQYNGDVKSAQTGRNVNIERNIEPLSKYGEASLSDRLIDWPITELQLDVDRLWVVCVRNLSRAIIVGDAKLIDSVSDHLHSCLQTIWSRLRINLVRSDRWAVRCQMQFQYPAGGVSLGEFHNLYHSAKGIHKEINGLGWDLHRSQVVAKRNLLELVRAHGILLKLFEDLAGLQGSTGIDAFNDVMRPQLLENVDKFDAWVRKMRVTTEFDIPIFQSEVEEICGPVLPKAMGEFVSSMDKIKAPVAAKHIVTKGVKSSK